MSLPVKRFPASSKRWQKPTSFLKSRAQKHGFPSPARTDSTPAGGDLISDCAKALKDIKEVAAIGINCTAPQYVESLIKEIVKVTDKPVVVYPNSGEDYDAGSKSWEGSVAKYEDYVKIWYEAGARLIGGCCRTGPEDIRKVAAFRKSLIEK